MTSETLLLLLHIQLCLILQAGEELEGDVCNLTSSLHIFFSCRCLSEFRARHEQVDTTPRLGGKSLPRPEPHHIAPPETPVCWQTRTADILLCRLLGEVLFNVGFIWFLSFSLNQSAWSELDLVKFSLGAVGWHFCRLLGIYTMLSYQYMPHATVFFGLFMLLEALYT